jgi:CDP-4-dehydro-6-deoxyglucose reductase, E1
MLMLNDMKNYKRAKILRSWGRMSSVHKNSENIKKRLNCSLNGKSYDNKFIFSEIAYNFEPSEIGAAFGIVQLSKFKMFEKTRQRNFQHHINYFKKFGDLFILPTTPDFVKTNHLAYPIILKNNKFFNRNQLQIFLEKNNIQTRPIFSGNILRHPAFKSLKKYNNVNNFPNSDYIMENGMLVGCHQGLSKSNISYIHKIISKFIKKIS